MSASDILAQIRADISALVHSADRPDVPIDELADVGTVMAGIVTSATKALEGLKQRLRAEALKTLGHGAGKAEFGADTVQVIVTVPPPRMVLADHADMAALQSALGEDFGTFFEERVSYVPRKDIADRIIELPLGPKRDALLGAVTEEEQTPRVAFTKV